MKIYLTGLGIKEGDISVKALNLLNSGKKVIVKTALTNSYKNITDAKIPHILLDEIYIKSRNFESLNKNLASEVLKAAKTEEIIYCVDGSVNEDNSCKIIISKHKDVEIISAPSKIDAILEIAKLDKNVFTAVSAYESLIKIKLPLIVYDIDSNYIASEIKLKLTEFFDEEDEILYINNLTKTSIKLYEIDRQKNYDYSTALVIYDKDLIKKSKFDYDELIEIIKRLRGENGCPWDRVQTHETIKINMIEEAYELVDAIESNDDDKLLEEAGDVLLQVVFHSIMAEERGAFNTKDVLSSICKKMIFRHTHIFGNDKAENPDEALNYWDRNKKQEKGHKTAGDTLKDLPKNFPSPLYAEKLQKRAAKVGFDFPDYKESLKKVEEEYNELLEAINENDFKHIEEEGGDLLFAVINTLRLLKVESEMALKASCYKFLNRFLEMENLITADGKITEQLNLEELERYYNAVKANKNR
jgi:tetrapyrrole methylase family protein/MazG family protein